MSRTKVIAFDIYDTLLCGDDSENSLPPRRGLAEFVKLAKSQGIKIVTSSDAYLTNLKLDLAATFRGRVPFGLEIFDGFYQLSMKPKNYDAILHDFGIKPEELLIIGDNPFNDFAGAPTESGKFLIPPYVDMYDAFDLMSIAIP